MSAKKVKSHKPLKSGKKLEPQKPLEFVITKPTDVSH